MESKHWIIVPELRLRWRHWNDEAIVYNCNSGDAHLLNPVGAEALKILEDTPVTVHELDEKVCRNLQIETSEDLQRIIHDYVLKLARLGLIHPADDSV